MATIISFHTLSSYYVSGAVIDDWGILFLMLQLTGYRPELESSSGREASPHHQPRRRSSGPQDVIYNIFWFCVFWFCPTSPVRLSSLNRQGIKTCIYLYTQLKIQMPVRGREEAQMCTWEMV